MIEDKELIRRALLGDKQAQEECTEKGIVLPCPKCFSDGVKIEGDGRDIYDPDTLGYLDSVPDSILYVTCDSCNLCSNCITVEDGEEREDAEKKLIAEWNTRPALPVIHAKWEWHGPCRDNKGTYWATCTACGIRQRLGDYENYCPKCGARMDLEGDEQ